MNNIDIKNLKVAKRYASALAESSGEQLDTVLENLKLIDELVFQNEELKTFFLHPVVSLKDKKETIKEAFEDKINEITFNFIEVLLDENRFGIFKTILELFVKESEKIKNMQRVEIVSAVGLDDKEKEKLSKKLSEKLNKDIILNYNLDESVLGGFVVKVEDKVVDLSLKAKFENLKKL